MQESLNHVFKTNLNLKTKEEFANFLKEELKKEGFLLTEKQTFKTIEFLQILLYYNEKFNLTKILNFEEIVSKHILDSLLILKVVTPQQGFKMLDIGAGAGFPSTPIAIVCSFLEITQIDSLKKRVDFLNLVKEKLKLNVFAFHKRAEEAAKEEKFREKFNLVTARAVSKLNVLCELSLPFVKLGGFFIALKGPNYVDELNMAKIAIEKLGGKLEEVKQFKLGEKATRFLILIKKISQTSSKYPRSFPKILKSPI